MKYIKTFENEKSDLKVGDFVVSLKNKELGEGQIIQIKNNSYAMVEFKNNEKIIFKLSKLKLASWVKVPWRSH